MAQEVVKEENQLCVWDRRLFHQERCRNVHGGGQGGEDVSCDGNGMGMG